MGRRGSGDDAIYFDHSGDCRDARLHKGCPGRWRGAVSLGYGPDGKRIRRKVSGQTKQDVKDKLGKLHSDLEAGVRAPVARYTVGQAIEDWLREGLDGRSEKTVALYRQVLQFVVERMGKVVLRELTAQDVRRVLAEAAGTRSSRTVGIMHNSLERAIRHAEANDYVRRNVAALVKPPSGQAGRPSRSLTLEQAGSLLAAAIASPLGAYVVLCLLTGVRTEEARALTWDHVDLDGNAASDPPTPPYVAVWRSVRAHGDTKTQRSRRTLQLSERAVRALREHQVRQADQRRLAGDLWQDRGLVFCTSVGSPLDASNVRREFRKITKAAGLGGHWAPRELRTSFVSLMSGSGVPVEEIARLAGHSSSRTTEVVYRRELRPVITTGAEVMDKIFSA
ncbi:MAG TPA: tyrosine-type recombinase/integrase [Streptosporangiaceae bacterium]|nr:tyrosine-type recombinase/integrase [Streptosporangiaceae bacterium]